MLLDWIIGGGEARQSTPYKKTTQEKRQQQAGKNPPVVPGNPNLYSCTDEEPQGNAESGKPGDDS